MHSRHVLLLLLLATLTLFAACSDSSDEPASDPDTTNSKASELAFVDKAKVYDFYRNFKPSQSHDDLGFDTFKSRCASCHGLEQDDPQTSAPNLASVRTVYVAQHGDLAKARTWLHNKILYTSEYRGVNAQGWSATMSQFHGQLSDEETKALVAMLTFKE